MINDTENNSKIDGDNQIANAEEVSQPHCFNKALRDIFLLIFVFLLVSALLLYRSDSSNLFALIMILSSLPTLFTMGYFHWKLKTE